MGLNSNPSQPAYLIPGLPSAMGNNVLVGTDSSSNLAAVSVVPVVNGGTNASSASITAFNNITGYSAIGATGTTSTNLVFSTSPNITTPTFTTNITAPLVIGGTTSTSSLILRSTSGNGTTGADIVFQTGNNGGTECMRIVNSGNVGIGITPSAWFFASIGLQLQSGALTAYGSNVQNLSMNAFLDSGASWTYVTTNPASLYQQSNDVHSWFSKASGTQNTAINFGIAKMNLDGNGNLLLSTSAPTTGTICLTVASGTAPTATPADSVTFYSSDLSAGNTMPSFYTEGTIVGTGTPTADRTVAVRINGTVYYLLASTIP